MHNNTKTIENEKNAPRTALETATEYFLKGWQPIPIPFRSKNPNFPNWSVQHTTRVEELTSHFNGKPQNISVLLGTPSNDLTDVDLDNGWSVQLAAFFLPETDAIFGRKSKRRSHFLYYCPEAKTEKFQYSEMIAEIRATGTQTVFPGSTHETGESVTWDKNGEPFPVSFQELRSAVGKLAAASLLAEFWIDTKRHDLSLCVSGALLTNGFSFEDAHLFIKAICTVTKDAEISDRLRTVETTYERIQDEKNVIGFPRLAELTNAKTVSLLRRWLDFPDKREPEIEIIDTNEGIENYRLTERGLFYVFFERTRGGKVKEVETFVCSPLKVVATGKDADDGERTQIVEFTNDDGRMKKINVSLRHLITEPQSILGELVANGLILNSREKLRLVDYLIYSKPEKRLTLVYKTGWQGKSFVMPDAIISNKLNTRVKNQATHISVSFAPGEKVKTEKKIEFAEKLLEKLDFKNVPFLVVEHHDKEYEHFHIIAGRIRDDGTTVKEWKIAERAIEATKELEKTLGLQRTEYTKSGDRRIKTNEFKQMERTNELSVMAEAKLTIDEILANQPTTEEFVSSLQRFGFDVRPNISEKNGRMNGFSFKKGEIKFKSSAIARNYSWQNLQKNGLKYDHARDTEFLIGVKNEFTQKLNFENGRDQGTETPKPVAERTESITDRAESGVNQSKSTSGKTDRSEVETNRNQTAGLSPDDPKAEFSEILSSAPALDASKQPAQTKISDRTVLESRHREKPVGSERNPKDNSGSEKSKDSQFIRLEVSFSDPQLNPAPSRETEKEASKNKDREKSYGNIMSR